MEGNEGQDTALHEAVRYGDLEETRTALMDGCNPDIIGTYQWTALHEAANNGDTDIVRLLLKFGADPNKEDRLRGCSAVHYAASEGQTECLEILLAAGGKFNFCNKDGQSCIDVAVGECRSMLEKKQKDRHCTDFLHDGRQDYLDERKLKVDSPSGSVSPRMSESGETWSEIDAISVDTADSISSSGSSFKRHTAINDKVLGHAVMSFEYNSKKCSFKIRVWKIIDLLLPPADTSLIHGIYVKSYLIGDKHKSLKRKTEQVHPGNVPQADQDNQSVIFQPSSFTFKRPLEYSGVTNKQVYSSDICLEVCVTQKYTHKSFTVASWTESLLRCTKSLLKEKYPLKPTISTNIPENMKVYHACEVQVLSSNQRLCASNPSLQRESSLRSWAQPYKDRASSESHLNDIKVETPADRKVPSIEISVHEADNDEVTELNEALQQIAIMEERERCAEGGRITGSSSAIIEMADYGRSFNDDEVMQSGDLHDVQIHSSSQETRAEVQVHISAEENGLCQSSTNDEKSKPRSLIRDHRKKEKKRNYLFNRDQDLGSASRPDTLTWDYYEEPLAITMVPIDFDEDTMTEPCLPMSLGMEMPEIHRSFSRIIDNNDTIKSLDHQPDKCELVSEV